MNTTTVKSVNEVRLGKKIIICDNKMLSYRRETALQGALQFSPKAEDWN